MEGYFRFVDDILLVYNDNLTDIEEILNSFNNITPGLNFTLEREQENKINFLDLTITKATNKCHSTYTERPPLPTPSFQTILATL